MTLWKSDIIYGRSHKTELLLLKLIHLFAREVLLVKKLENEETKTTQYSTFKTDIIKVGLVFSISNFFITITSLANKWMRKKHLLAVIQLYAYSWSILWYVKDRKIIKNDIRVRLVTLSGISYDSIVYFTSFLKSIFLIFITQNLKCRTQVHM